MNVYKIYVVKDQLYQVELAASGMSTNEADDMVRYLNSNNELDDVTYTSSESIDEAQRLAHWIVFGEWTNA